MKARVIAVRRDPETGLFDAELQPMRMGMGTLTSGYGLSTPTFSLPMYASGAQVLAGMLGGAVEITVTVEGKVLE